MPSSNIPDNNYIGVIDIGTTTVKFLIFSAAGKLISESYAAVKQYYPQPGWVEEDPVEIWALTQRVITNAFKQSAVNPEDIKAVGICNQRESVVAWDSQSGKPLSELIVWQDRRTSDRCRDLIECGYSKSVSEKTGLIIDPYFSATKLEWILKNKDLPSIETGNIKLGTVDSWIIYNLTGFHLTDVSNASRTLLFNISTLEWDQELLDIFGIPSGILPQVRPSFGKNTFGFTKEDSPFKCRIPVCSDLGDQQAALFGQKCFKKGELKSTYGTGAFMMVNTGRERVKSNNKLLTTIFYGKENGEVLYALEASIYNAGSVFQWLKEGIELIKDFDEIKIDESTNYRQNLYFVPSFTGLGAPYGDPYSRGLIIGITRATNKKQIIRAAIESLAYRSRDVLAAMEKDLNLYIGSMKIDGGVTSNRFFCQILSDITGINIKKSDFKEYTALGAMYAAAMGTGLISSSDSLGEAKEYYDFYPKLDRKTAQELYAKWLEAINRSRNWENGQS